MTLATHLLNRAPIAAALLFVGVWSLLDGYLLLVGGELVRFVKDSAGGQFLAAGFVEGVAGICALLASLMTLSPRMQLNQPLIVYLALAVSLLAEVVLLLSVDSAISVLSGALAKLGLLGYAVMASRRVRLDA